MDQPQDFVIRPAALADVPAWMGLRAALWPDTDADTHRREIEAILAESATIAVLIAADTAGRAIGFVELSIRKAAEECVTDRIGYVEGWYVDSEWRRQGVGRALIAAAENWAVAKGCREMASDAKIENGISQAAHRRLGYAEAGQLVHFRKALPTR